MNVTETVTDHLQDAAWKLHGIAGMFNLKQAPGGVALSDAATHGVFLILTEIARGIAENADLITEAKQPK